MESLKNRIIRETFDKMTDDEKRGFIERIERKLGFAECPANISYLLDCKRILVSEGAIDISMCGDAAVLHGVPHPNADNKAERNGRLIKKETARPLKKGRKAIYAMIAIIVTIAIVASITIITSGEIMTIIGALSVAGSAIFLVTSHIIQSLFTDVTDLSQALQDINELIHK